MHFTSTFLAQALTGAVTTTAVQHPPSPPAIELPSEGIHQARHAITLTALMLDAGHELEAIMRAAVFRGTEHRYDL